MTTKRLDAETALATMRESARLLAPRMRKHKAPLVLPPDAIDVTDQQDGIKDC